MNRVKSGLLVLCLATALTGCYKHSFTVGKGGGDVTTRDATFETWRNHWFFGLIGEDNVDVASICPTGNATIKDQHSFVNLLIGFFIGVVWHPTTVQVWCDAGGGEGTTTSVLIPAETMKALSMHPEMVNFVREVAPESVERFVAAKHAFEAKVCTASAN